MPAPEPTILATSGGLREGRRTRYEFSELTEYAVDLAGVSGRAPRICFLATAQGDNPAVLHNLYAAAQLRGYRATHLTLIPIPNVADPAELLLAADVIWVAGGSVAALLALWRLHDLAPALTAAWRAGVVLTGVSAGSICWHTGGTTDSFGPDLRPITDGLALLPYANGVHTDSEPERRPLFQRLVDDRTLAPGYATDDGVGLLYRGTTFAGALAENGTGGAYFVEPGAEHRLDVTRLRPARNPAQPCARPGTDPR